MNISLCIYNLPSAVSVFCLWCRNHHKIVYRTRRDHPLQHHTHGVAAEIQLNAEGAGKPQARFPAHQHPPLNSEGLYCQRPRTENQTVPHSMPQTREVLSLSMKTSVWDQTTAKGLPQDNSNNQHLMPKVPKPHSNCHRQLRTFPAPEDKPRLGRPKASRTTKRRKESKKRPERTGKEPDGSRTLAAVL